MSPFLKMNCLFIVPVNLFGSCPIFYEGELGISLFWLGVSYSGAAELGVYSSSQQVPNCNVQKGKVLSKQQSPSLVPPSDIDYTVLQEAGAATLTTSKLRLCSNKVDSQPTTTIHFLCGKRSLFSLPRTTVISSSQNLTLQVFNFDPNLP